MYHNTILKGGVTSINSKGPIASRPGRAPAPDDQSAVLSAVEEDNDEDDNDEVDEEGEEDFRGREREDERRVAAMIMIPF